MKRLAALSTTALLFLSGCYIDPFNGTDALITNEYETPYSADWDVTSGSMYRKNNKAWTDSPVFRVVTRAEYSDVDVLFDLTYHRFTGGTAAFDGVHVFMRYQSQYHLYYASINRRDGAVVIKKKVPGGPSNGGTYYTLASIAAPSPSGIERQIHTRVWNNADGTVTITIFRPDGTILLSTTDSGVGGPPITSSGQVGVRGDNSEFSFDTFTVAERSEVGG